MHTVHGDDVTGIKRCRHDLSGDGVRNLTTVSGRGRLKEDLESSTWRRYTAYGIVKLSVKSYDVKSYETCIKFLGPLHGE
ncbi:hypothetical protein Tco_1297556 [Tanacetum coccineum]